MKCKLPITIICCQLLFITLLLIKIYIQKYGGLPISVSEISSRVIQIVKGKRFQYYYEPIPGFNKETHKEKLDGTKAVYYSINKDTLHEQRFYSVEKPPGTFRVEVLGDSFTYGIFVNTNDNWTELVEDKLHKSSICKKFIEVMNFGVTGYDPSYEVERYITRGEKYNPDLVILFLTDPYRNTEMIHILAAKHIGEYKNDRDGSKGWAAGYREWEKNIPEGDKYIYQMKALIRLREHYKGPIVIMLLKKPTNKIEFKYTYDFIKKDSNSRVVEVTNTIQDPRLHFKTDFHPNEEGHRAIAKDIFQYITKNKIIPCSPETSQ